MQPNKYVQQQPRIIVVKLIFIADPTKEKVITKIKTSKPILYDGFFDITNIPNTKLTIVVVRKRLGNQLSVIIKTIIANKTVKAIKIILDFRIIKYSNGNKAYTYTMHPKNHSPTL